MASGGTSPLNVIKAIEKYVQSEVAMGLSSEDDACKQQLGNVVARIKNMTIEHDHAAAAFDYLGTDESIFNVEHRKEIASAIKASMSTTVVTPTKRHGFTMQTHRFLHNYLPAKLWGVLLSSETMKHKMRFFASFLVQHLGLRCIEEGTKRLSVVIILLCSKLDPDPHETYKLIVEFAEIFDQKRASIKTAQTLIKFPEDPLEFMVMYPKAYAPDDPPVECRLDLADIAERCRKDLTPCRKTNLRVARSSSFASTTPATSPTNALVRHGDLGHAGIPFGQSDMDRPITRGEMLAMMRHFMARQTQPSSSVNLDAILDTRPPLEKRADFDDNRARDIGDLFPGGVPPACMDAPKRTPAADSVHEKLQQLRGEMSIPQTTPASVAQERANKRHAQQVADAAKRAKRAGTSSTSIPIDPSQNSDNNSEASDDSELDVAKTRAKPKKPPTKNPTKKKEITRKTSNKPPSVATVGKAKKGADTAKLFESLLKRPRPKHRPQPCYTMGKTTSYNGGKIYWSKKKSGLRVYKRSPADRVETTVHVASADKKVRAERWNIACALIEADPRPS